MKILFIVLLALAGLTCNAQELFKPGSTYLAGQEVQDVYGTVWKVKKRVGIAVSPPAQNDYYAYVRVQSPAMATAPGYNVLDYGVSQTNTPEQNSLAIESLINSFPEGATPSIYIPYGNYKFARSINFTRRPVYLHGDSGSIWGNSTKLYFPYNSDGIKIEGSHGISIERICLIGSGGDGSKGNGIYTNSITKLKQVTLKSFSQNGLLIWANLESEGGNASGSYIESCHAIENGHDGFFAGRVDGSAITFIGCDARDNKRYGFNEDSFLGNTYISNMCHDNKAGHYYVRDKGNARTTIISAYCEGGVPPSQLSRLTTVIGGIWPDGYDLLDGRGVQYK